MNDVQMLNVHASQPKFNGHIHHPNTLRRYERAVDVIKYDDSFSAGDKRTARDIKKAAHLNLAAANIKLGKHREGCKTDDEVSKASALSDQAKALCICATILRY